jgi:carboxymethylenebutenolidase
MANLALPYFAARPADEPSAPGVVVLHEGGGISEQLLRFCQRLAAEGYAVKAPDLFYRVGGTGAGDYRTLMGSVTPDQLVADIDSCIADLHRDGAAKVGVTGFCMGGHNTWRAALHAKGVSAAVGFYGAGIAAEPGEPACPTLLFFGGKDPYIPADDINLIASRHPDTVVYPDAGHGFMRDGSADYHPEAAPDAWARTLEFFGAHLH